MGSFSYWALFFVHCPFICCWVKYSADGFHLLPDSLFIILHFILSICRWPSPPRLRARIRFSCIRPAFVRGFFDFCELWFVRSLCVRIFYPLFLYSGFLNWLLMAMFVFLCMQLALRRCVFMLCILSSWFVFRFLCDLIGWFCLLGFVVFDELMCFFSIPLLLLEGDVCWFDLLGCVVLSLFILHVHTGSLHFLCWIPYVCCCLHCIVPWIVAFFSF